MQKCPNANNQKSKFEMENFTNGSKMRAIVELTSIWFVNKQFGCTFNVLQCQVYKPEKIQGWAFEPDTDDDEEGSDLALTLGDTLSSRILLSLLFFPAFAYSTICNSVTWQVPTLFYFFLPIIKILSKTLRSFNTSLRIISNTTSSHLLILLLTAALEIARVSPTQQFVCSEVLPTIIMSALLSFVVILEIVVSALQGYIFSALVLYYTHVNE